MLPDLPLRVWLGILAIPVAFLCLAAAAGVWAFRASDRWEAKRQSMIAQFLASRGSHLSAEDADCDRVAAALLELREGGAPFQIYWVAPRDGGTLFEYRVGPGIGKHGYGYLERSPFPRLTSTVRITPRARWMSIDTAPTFRFGREVGEGWTNPEFHKRYEVRAQDVAEGSRVATSRLQFLLLELPDVSGKAVDRELVELAVNRSHWTVLGRKVDWADKKIVGGFPNIEDHLRLAGRIRDALGR